jgi:hypothetical protein
VETALSRLGAQAPLRRLLGVLLHIVLRLLQVCEQRLLQLLLLVLLYLLLPHPLLMLLPPLLGERVARGQFLARHGLRSFFVVRPTHDELIVNSVKSSQVKSSLADRLRNPRI